MAKDAGRTDARLAAAVADHRAGRLAEAAAGYAAVLRDAPDNADALQLLGLVAHRMGHPDDALALFDRALAADKRHGPALANRGMVLRALGRLDDAADSLRRAVRFRPDLGDAWLTLARVEGERGRLEAAAEAVRRADALMPGSAEVDAVRAAIDGARDPVRALAAAVVAGERGAAVALADALAIAPDPPTGIDDGLLRALAIDGVDHQRLDRAVQAALTHLQRDPEALLAHPLTAPWLSRVLVRDSGWEAALVDARSWLLDRALAGDAEPLILSAVGLAVHAFHAEYAWQEPADDAARLDRLDPDQPLHAAVRAAYRPPPPSLDRDGWREGSLAPLIRCALREPAEEDALGAAIPELFDGDDASSGLVRGMYEASPYPRLVGVQVRQPIPLAEALARVLPHAPDLAVPQGRVSVLVAGCGTGQHPLTTATTWDCTVLGVDLSRRSLGRAARVARALGVTNVTFRRADLLRLGEHPDQYDVVESVGVLHHLADPWAGWRVLRGKVRPGGLMRIGVYAERSRADIAAARALIADHRLPDSPDGIREARRLIQALPADHPARPVVGSPDFTSISGCRDLLFHVREHLTRLPRIGEALRGLDLELLGLQHLLPTAPALYRARFPDDPAQRDLDRWDALEAEHPRLFTGMYVVWARARR